MKITIKSAEVTTRNGVSARTGRPWTIKNQSAIVEKGEERREIQLQISENASGYAPGEYEIDFEKSTRFGRFGELELKGELVLKLPQKQSTGMFAKAG